MIARGFKPVAWVAAIGTAALGCYMLSLRVASERAELAGLERKIVNTQKAIRSLQTELDTRGRVTQLQQWNDEILALAPPSAGQFLDSQMMLAQFQVPPAPAIENPAEVRMAAAEAPAPAPAPSVTAPVQRAVAAPRPPQPATVQRASLNLPPKAVATQPARTRTASTETPRPRTTPPRTEARATAARMRAQTTPQRQRTGANTPAPRTQPAATTPPQRARVAAATTPPRTRTTAAATPQRTRTAATQTPPRRSPALLDNRTVRDIGATSRSERRGGTRN